MPGPRIEIAELLVLHLVELDVELDGVLVRIAVIGGDVVAGPVPHRPPQQPDVLMREHLAGGLHVRHVLQLEGDVVHLDIVALDEVHGVMVRVAAHEHEPVLDPVRDLKAHHLGVEIGRRLHVRNVEGDVAELERSDAGNLVMLAEIAPFGEQVDAGAFVVLEA